MTSTVLTFAVSALTFVLVSLTPGDAARAVLGRDATPEQYRQLRAQLGLDEPLAVQYWHWLVRAVHGDLGTALSTGQPVLRTLEQRLGPSLSLITGALVVSALLGVGLGVLSAVRGGAVGRALDLLSMLGLALPSFWLGLVLVAAFAVALPIFPASGYVPLTDSPWEWLRSLALPVLTLGIGGSATIAKQTRDAMLDEMGRDYIVLLRARGLPERSIVLRHALKNAAVPVVTVLGLLFVGLLSGSVLAETVYVVPGLGSTAVTATQAHDIPLIQGVALCFTVIVITVNLLVELLYGRLDPRSRG
ncbi:ABC transporter permease [Streptomyces muensis]|uniref:ABC transporter permease n=1 Tax=Streptomyces muensis TaxID=1077944 RepID=A0A9X1PSQ1_STRM4|nr:ABC transporter permease [Streptomyces muensis]